MRKWIKKILTRVANRSSTITFVLGVLCLILGLIIGIGPMLIGGIIGLISDYYTPDVSLAKVVIDIARVVLFETPIIAGIWAFIVCIGLACAFDTR